LETLAGLSFESISFSLWRNGQKLRVLEGDVLITHEGLSGPGILDASRHIVAGDRVEVDFSGRGRELFREEFTAALMESPRASVRKLAAETGLPRRMAERLCELARIDSATTASTLRREEREGLLALATAFPLVVASLGGWDRAMVTAGGVERSEVDPGTMESRLVPGLFFAGELLDIDGDTGGYNLQAAFSTAALAAKAIARKLAVAKPIST